MLRLPGAAAGLMLALGGCSPYAHIARREGPPIEARIVGSDATHLIVETPDGQRQRVARDEVAEIDHPGNVAMAVGLPNTVVGVLFGVITVFVLPAAIEQGWPKDEAEDPGAAPVALVFGLIAAGNLAIGLPPFIWGSRAWFDSTGNALPPAAPEVRVGPGFVRVRF